MYQIKYINNQLTFSKNDVEKIEFILLKNDHLLKKWLDKNFIQNDKNFYEIVILEIKYIGE